VPKLAPLGGEQIDYVDEKPAIRRLFADALGKHGLTSRMERAYEAEQLETANSE